MNPISSRGALDKAVAKEHEMFQRALGRMSMMWSDLENNLFVVIRRYAGVSDAVAKALFAGSRARQMITALESIAINTKMEERDPERFADLDEIFKRIILINGMRDTITHHAGASLIEFDDLDPNTRYLRKHRVSRYGEELKFKISSSLLQQMSADLLECCWRLHAHSDKDNTPFKPGVGPDGTRHAWLYKSPLQGKSAKQSAHKTRKSSSQPKSSQP
jgi:hypothetical protein